MKRMLLLLTLLFAVLPMSAQYMPADGLLSQKGTKVFADGRKLTKGEIAATLSLIRDDKGLGCDIAWNHAKNVYNAGIALTSLGGACILAGGAVFSYGFLYLITMGIASPLYVFGDGYTSDLDNLALRAGNMLVAGSAVCFSGLAMIGAGIPLICVYNSRMKKIIRRYNDNYGTSGKMTLKFGPTGNGVGLALNF